jgi:protein TilB
LEEITLHQFDIEKIELLGSVCKNLKILFFQNNLISKIGNLLFWNVLQGIRGFFC